MELCCWLRKAKSETNSPTTIGAALPHSTMDSVLALKPAAMMGSVLIIPEDLLLTIIYSLNVGEINWQQNCLILSG